MDGLGEGSVERMNQTTRKLRGKGTGLGSIIREGNGRGRS